MGKKTKSGKDNRSSNSRNYIDKRYFGKVPDDSFFDLSPRNGYVIYQKGPNETSFWYQIWRQGANYLDSLRSVASVGQSDFGRVGQYLINLGKAELNREINLINNLLNTNLRADEVLGNPLKFKEFISLLNQALLGKDEFERTVKRIENAIKIASSNKWKVAPPSVSSLFVERFITDYIKEVENFANLSQENYDVFASGDLTPIYDQLEQLFDQQFEKTFRTFIADLEAEGRLNSDSIYGEAEDYKKIYEYLDQLKGQEEKLNEFFKRIQQSMKFKSIFEKLQKSMPRIGTNMKKRHNTSRSGLLTSLNGVKKSKRTGSVVGGSVAELMLQAISTMTVQLNVTKGGGSVFGYNPPSQIQKVDQALIISMNTSAVEDAIKPLYDDLYSEEFKSLNDAARKMSDFTEQVFGKLQDGFIVYTSQKMYTLNDDFAERGGFSGGTQRPITTLKEIANNLGNQAHVDALIKLAINAIPGAYLEDYQNYITEAITVEIAHAMAYLLFDDWTSFTSANLSKNVIHVFSLEGLEVPLSYLLRKTGESFLKADRDTENYLKTQITYGNKGVIFQDGDYKYITGKDGKPHTTVQAIVDAWNQQRDAAEKSVKFSIHFLGAFAELLGQDLS